MNNDQFLEDQSDGSGSDWETPIEFADASLTRLEEDSFGENFLGNMISEVSNSLEAPIELAGAIGLAVISASVMKKYVVEIEADSGYQEPLNLWAICAMEPSTRKSAILKQMAKPIHDWQTNQKEIFHPLIVEARSTRATEEAHIKERRKTISKIDEQPNREQEKQELVSLEKALTPVPRVPRLLIDDCTPEKLAVMLSEQGERLAYLDSESDALFSMMMGKYSDSPQLDIYLKSYGGEPLHAGRMGREDVELLSPLLTLGVCPQPVVLERLGNKPELIDRGLLARFLFWLPPSNLGNRQLDPVAISEAVKSRYRLGIRDLLGRQTSDSSPPKGINLTVDAYQQWKDWQRSIEEKMRLDNVLGEGPMRSWGGKLAGNTARVAGLLHCVESFECNFEPDKVELSSQVMERAIRIADSSISHSLAVHNLTRADATQERAKQIHAHLRSNRIQETSLRAIHYKLRNRKLFKTAHLVRDGLKRLKEMGWVKEGFGGDPATTGRPKEIWLVHRKLFSNV
ncbi:YfjI family protein [Mariniblastus sp.]|nr:YfjI family protein [Mariniblastus sp.]MDB4756394.1 YfjI family protein [Mariniblastus sp.]